jgi:hypothetical protein
VSTIRVAQTSLVEPINLYVNFRQPIVYSEKSLTVDTIVVVATLVDPAIGQPMYIEADTIPVYASMLEPSVGLGTTLYVDVYAINATMLEAEYHCSAYIVSSSIPVMIIVHAPFIWETGTVSIAALIETTRRSD